MPTAAAEWQPLAEAGLGGILSRRSLLSDALPCCSGYCSMVLVLSPADLGRLRAAITTCVSPLDYPSLDAWGQAVMRTGRELLGADQSFIGMPRKTFPLWAVGQDTHGEVAIRDYLTYYHQVDFVLRRRRLELGLRIYHRDMLYRPGELERDELHNDWCRPYRLFDTLGMGVSVPEHPDIPACAHFYHAREGAQPFGERGVALLELLYPAFAAGIDTVRRLGERATEVRGAFDALEDGVLMLDPAGTTLYQNAALGRLLGAEPDPVRLMLERALREASNAVRALLMTGPGHAQAGPPAPVSRTVATARARYQISGSLLRQGTLGFEPLVLVTLARLTQVPFTEVELRARYGLTPREIEVARLVAEGGSSGAIATRLGISPATARRHTEHLLGKLGVHSRAAVGTALRR